MSKMIRRALHTTSARQSHIGSAAITIPKPVNLEFPFGQPASSSTSTTRTLAVAGPLGRQELSIPSWVVLEREDDTMRVTVLDAEDRKQRSIWGLTRTLINNAIVGVSVGYTLDLRLVGVGYRAAVEAVPQALIDLQKQIPRTIRAPRPGQPPYVPPQVPTSRLNMKLGYAHPVYVDIPEGIRVSTPAPTTISLSGTDKQKLGLLAARIRRWRKPEPYRGKGIFVGDETIKLKEIKKK